MDKELSKSNDLPVVNSKDHTHSTKDNDNVTKAKRGPYKRYLHRDSVTKIPASTKHGWKKKRILLSNKKSCPEPSTSKEESVDDVTPSVGSTTWKFYDDEDAMMYTNASTAIECNDASHRPTNEPINEDNGTNTRYEGDLGTDYENETTAIQRDNIISETAGCDENDEKAFVGTEKYSENFMIKTLLVLATKLRHNLTYEASEDIVKLLNVISGTPLAEGSKYCWKKLIQDFSSCMTVHHICKDCGLYAGMKSDGVLQCKECGARIDAKENIKANNAFLYISLTYQLREIFELTKAHIKCQMKRKKQCECAIEDIFDSKLYKQIIIDGMITINFSVDGVPVFDSSNMSMHPVLCSINELDPQSRKKHVLLCGLWFGKGKPNINEYLKPFVDEAKKLYTDGFTYEYEGTIYTRKCRVLSAVCDSIARPMLRNSTQFNGKYGCGLCLHSGEAIAKGRGYTRVYPLGPEENPWGEGLRTLEETLKHAEEKIKGMKGRSVLCDIPGFNIVNSLDVDWMHAVGLGVCRQFGKLWFDSKYHNEDFYFGHLIHEVDELLLSYTPTAEVSRTPRKMSDQAHWKAHEWVIFLLFYSLPILDALFPKKYVCHWALLVDAIQMLSQTSIMRSKIVLAHGLLIQFIDGVENLYGRQFVSFNVHLLSHLGQSVEMLGPLWTHSAFIYENANQALLSYVKSSCGVALQICDTFRTKCVVDRLHFICNKKLRTAEKEYLDKMLKRGSRPKPSFSHPDGCMLGAVTVLEKLSRLHHLAFKRANVNITQNMLIESYKRATINGEIYHSEAYTLVEKRRNYYVLLFDNEIFKIELFYVLKDNNSVSCFAIGNYFEKDAYPLIRGRELNHLILLKKCLPDLAVIRLNTIKEKVTVLNVNHLQKSVACVHPNHYELLT